MFYVIITSNVIIVMRQKFRLLLPVVFSLRDEMEGKGDASEGGANFLSNRDLRAMMFTILFKESLSRKVMKF